MLHVWTRPGQQLCRTMLDEDRSMQVLTVTCNTAVDTTYRLAALRLGEINRVDRVLSAPGGKGNNVARVLAALGHQPIATGFVAGQTGHRIEQGLTATGIRPDFERVPGESRTCLTLIEPDQDRTTEIREPGVPVTDTDGTRLLERIARRGPEIDVAVVSGSLPPGLPPDFYRQLIALLKQSGTYVALDTSGEALRQGVMAGPDLVKPNQDELADLVGRLPELDELPTWAQRHLFGSVLPESATVLLTLGAAGAVLIRRDTIVRASAPSVTIVNAVGSGDALLAGYLDARDEGDAEREALARAVATGTAAAMQESIGTIDVTAIDDLRKQVRTTVIPSPVGTTQRDAVAAVPDGDTRAGRGEHR